MANHIRSNEWLRIILQKSAKSVICPQINALRLISRISDARTGNTYTLILIETAFGILYECTCLHRNREQNRTNERTYGMNKSEIDSCVH